MLKAALFLQTLAVAPVLSLLGGCWFLPSEHDGSFEDIVRVAATSDGGALAYMQRAIGTCTSQPFAEGHHCNLVKSWHLAMVPGAEGPIHRWEVDMDPYEVVQLVREITSGRYELHSRDGTSLRIRTFDEQGNKIADELAGPAPTQYNYVGIAHHDSHTTELADGSVLSINVQAMPMTLTYRDPAGQEQWTVPDPISVLDVADGGPAGSTVLGGREISWGPVVMKLDAAGTVVWQRDVWTLPRYMK